MSLTGSPPPSGRVARRLTGGALLAGGLIGATLFGALPSAFANQDPALNPPNCSAADLRACGPGVDASTSAYLFSHPDYNYFVTSLEGLPQGPGGQADEGLPERSTRTPRPTSPASGSRCST